MRIFLSYIFLSLSPFLAIHTVYSQSKNGIKIIDDASFFASYSYNYQEDSTSTSSRKELQMWLHICNDFSHFAHNCFFRMDSAFYECLNINDQSKVLKIGSQLKGDAFSSLTQYRIIKERSSNKINFYEVISSTYYQISDDISFNWQICLDMDTIIAGYRCREARTKYRGRAYRAWYTLAIPINEGPYKFKGLPGLIVKLEDTQKQHCFELNCFKKITPTPIFLWDKQFVLIKPSQYPKLKHNEALSRAGQYNNVNIANVAPDKIGKIEAKILRRNNLIEKF